MTDTKMRGRPRNFDPHQAAETAMKLFWAHGYETVGIADLTREMGIKPPSLYATFGSKAGVLEKAIEIYNAYGFEKFKPVFEASTATEFFGDLLIAAALFYTAHPEQKGCLVLDGTRNTDDIAALKVATKHRQGFRDRIAKKLSTLGVEDAEFHADVCLTAMTGLSGAARHGVPREQLKRIATRLLHGQVAST